MYKRDYTYPRKGREKGKEGIGKREEEGKQGLLTG